MERDSDRTRKMSDFLVPDETGFASTKCPAPPHFVRGRDFQIANQTRSVSESQSDVDHSSSDYTVFHLPLFKTSLKAERNEINHALYMVNLLRTEMDSGFP